MNPSCRISERVAEGDVACVSKMVRGQRNLRVWPARAWLKGSNGRAGSDDSVTIFSFVALIFDQVYTIHSKKG